MAKAKKQELTEEERLAAALVPEDEQPYEVPGNWVWTYLGKVCEIQSGTKNSGIALPYLDVKTLRGNEEIANKNSGVAVEMGTRAILVDGENSGEVFLINRRGYLGSTLRVLKFKNQIDVGFMEYFISRHREQLKKNKKGSAIPHLNKDIFYTLLFTLPPLTEQQRIVERIESLFEKLDHAKELAQSALECFETRKAAILHKAFTGELTAKWRKENGIDIKRWEKKPLKDIAKIRSGYAFDSKTFVDTGYQIIRMGNLYNGVLDLSRSPVFISGDSVDEATRKKFTAINGDILLTLTGTKYKRDYGYAVLIEHDANLLVNQRIMAITPESIEQNLLLYYLRSDIFRDIFF